jgi:DNA-binding response OmpR family regulator
LTPATPLSGYVDGLPCCPLGIMWAGRVRLQNGGGSMRAGGSTVLVVDDDRDICTLLQDVLESEGYACECLQDSEQALTRIQAGGIALVLMDHKLSPMSGVELCRRVRAIEAGTQVPNIITTALPLAAGQEASRLAGADAFLAKPFELAELLALVDRYCRR